MLVARENVAEDEVDNSKGKNTNDETNQAIEDSVFSFLDFTSITGRSHIVNATDNHDDHADEAEDTNDTIDNTNDRLIKVATLIVDVFAGIGIVCRKL